jgi:hypothetical protein
MRRKEDELAKRETEYAKQIRRPGHARYPHPQLLQYNLNSSFIGKAPKSPGFHPLPLFLLNQSPPLTSRPP